MKKDALTTKFQHLRNEMIETIKNYVYNFGKDNGKGNSIEFYLHLNETQKSGIDEYFYGVIVENGIVYVDHHYDSGELQPLSDYTLDEIYEIIKKIEEANNKLEYQIGDVIQFGAKKVKVVKWNSGCSECIFQEICIDCTNFVRKFVGECEASQRKTDNTDVIFKEIKENE